MEAALFFLVRAMYDLGSSDFNLSQDGILNHFSQIISRTSVFRAHLNVLLCALIEVVIPIRTERPVVLSLTHLRGYRSKHYISSLFLLVRWILTLRYAHIFRSFIHIVIG